MAKTIDELFGIKVLKASERCDTLTPEKAEVFHAVTIGTIPELQNFVQGFEESLLHVRNGRRSQYVHDMVQESDGSLEFMIGDVEFSLNAPASSPSYAGMVRGFLKYAEFLLSKLGQGHNIAGVRAMEGQLYMSVWDSLMKLDEYQHIMTEEKNPEIKYSYRNPRLKDLVKTLFFKESDVGKLTPANARKYTIAKEQLKLHERNIVAAFREAVKEEVGVEVDEMPLDVARREAFTLGRFLVLDLVSPKQITRYQEVFEGLRDYLQIGEASVRATGYGNRHFRLRDGYVYASIPGIALEVMELLQDPDITKKTVQHTIRLVPKPKYDSVLVLGAP